MITEHTRITHLYRVGNPNGQGLWYDLDGKPTGLAKARGLQASDLYMEPDPIFRDQDSQWFSATDTVKDLAKWFTEAEMVQLVADGYRVERHHVWFHRHIASPHGYAHQVFRHADVLETFIIDPMSPYREVA